MKHNWENYFDISSEYWLKVEKIYEDSESFPKKVVKDRNLHHKFPRSFSKKDGANIDNDDDNLVSLSLADHFRVHYYLWKCAKTGYRGMMARAFTLMRKKAVVYASDETIEQIAKDYEVAMKEAAEAHSKVMKGEKNPMYGKHHSEETKKKIGEAMKGKNFGEKSPMYGKHHTDETIRKISEAMKGKHLSEETKKKLSEAMKGKPKSKETRNKMSEAKKNMSEETKKKIGAASKGNTNAKGMRWFNNGEKCIRAKECPPGFVPGRLK